MFSGVIKYLENSKFDYIDLGNIKTIVYVLLIIACVQILRKTVIRRWHHFNIFPAGKLRLFNPWGHVIHIVTCSRVKEFSVNVYFLQSGMAYAHLFRDVGYYYAELAYYPFIIATSADVVEAIISESKNTEKSWFYNWFQAWLGTGLLTSHGSKWKSRRKLLTPSFHFDILKEFLPIFNEQSQILVKLLENETKQPWTDMFKLITLCTLDIACETTLGVSIGAQKDSESEYVQAVMRAADTFTKRVTYPPYAFDWYFYLSRTGFQFRKDVKLLHNFTRKVIAQRKLKLLSDELTEEDKGKKRKALLDLLLEQHVQNKALTEDDIREEVDTFVFEGHDTTSAGITWALYLIGLYKDVQEKIHEEIYRIFGDDCDRSVTTDDLKDLEYLDRVLKESQRLYPSVPIIGRKLSEDITIRGTKLPKGFHVIILSYALHRDESVFPNAEKFDPDRFLPENTAKRNPFAYIPFSAGPRNCIGQRFAVMEEKVVIINIMRNYKIDSLDERDRVNPVPEMILRPAEPLRIKLRSRRLTSS